MKRYFILAAALVAGTALWAQAPGPGMTPQQGFTVETLLSQISLYVPEEATQGLLGGRFGGAGGGGARSGTQAGQAGQGTQGAGAGQQSFRQLFQFTRDPKLYLTKDQIAKLIPILQGLRQNPLPTPSKAKQVQADVDSILSVAQKAEYEQYRQQMQKAIDQIRKQFAASGSGSGTNPSGTSAGQGGGNGSAGGQSGQGGSTAQGQARQGTQLTPTERRQRELDAFIKMLQDRQKTLQA